MAWPHENIIFFLFATKHSDDILFNKVGTQCQALEWSPPISAFIPSYAVLQRVRQFLPVDCVTVFFKSKTIKSDNQNKRCEGLSGALLFAAVDQSSSGSGAPSRQNSSFHGSESSGGLSRVSKFFRRWVFGEKNASAATCFKNTCPGVMAFQSRLNVPLDNAGSITTYCIERMTGHKLQVTTTALLARMRRRSLESILSLRDTFKSMDNTMIVVFQGDPVDTFVLQHVKSVFEDVLVMTLSGEIIGDMRSVASGGTATPPDRKRVLVMMLRLLPKLAKN